LTDLKEEKEINKHRGTDHEKWQALVKKLETDHEKYVAEKTAEIADLKEQVRDLMFFLEGQQKINESSLKDELVSGQVVVGPAQPTTSKRNPRRNTKK